MNTKNIKPLKSIFIFIMLMAIMPFAEAAPQGSNNSLRNYSSYSKLSSSVLLKKAEKYLVNGVNTDSAMLCLTIVTHRYNKDMTDEDKIKVISAYNGLWYIRFFTYFDYAKSYDALITAQHIANEINHSETQIQLNLGCFYQTLAEEGKDEKLMRKALDAYRIAFREGLRQKDSNGIINSFGNMVTVCAALHCMDSLDGEWKQFAATESLHPANLFKYTSLLYKGVIAKEHNDYDRALQYFKEQYPHTSEERDYIRNRILMFVNIGGTLACQKKYEEAAEYTMKALDLSYKFDLKDSKLQCYELLAGYYSKAGQAERSNTYHNKFYQLKDTLLNYQQLASVKDIQFLSQINKLDEQITRADMMNTIKNYIIGLCAVVVVIILVLLVELYRRNKALRINNEMLFNKNQEILEQEQRERQERLDRAGIGADAPSRKYQGNPINESKSYALMSEIRTVLDTSSEVFSYEFNLNRLAQMVNEQPKNVSQVINQLTGNNFNTFINEYRIKEACKRISDRDNYGNMTLEAIANSVGFKSVNSFRTAFKKVTGLFPSKYQQLADKKNRAAEQS